MTFFIWGCTTWIRESCQIWNVKLSWFCYKKNERPFVLVRGIIPMFPFLVNISNNLRNYLSVCIIDRLWFYVSCQSQCLLGFWRVKKNVCMRLNFVIKVLLSLGINWNNGTTTLRCSISSVTKIRKLIKPLCLLCEAVFRPLCFKSDCSE